MTLNNYLLTIYPHIFKFNSNILVVIKFKNYVSE